MTEEQCEIELTAGYAVDALASHLHQCDGYWLDEDLTPEKIRGVVIALNALADYREAHKGSLDHYKPPRMPF